MQCMSREQKPFAAPQVGNCYEVGYGPSDLQQLPACSCLLQSNVLEPALAVREKPAGTHSYLPWSRASAELLALQCLPGVCRAIATLLCLAETTGVLLEVQMLGNVTAGLPAALVRCSASAGQVLRPFTCLRLRLPDQAPAKECCHVNFVSTNVSR